MILIRFDDLCPRMNWKSFVAIKEVLHGYNIKSILGVIPENLDPGLNLCRPNFSFYQSIRSYAAYGDSIAQHGTYHLYTSKSSGILKINNNSEFAGHPFEYQLSLLNHGKRLLASHGIYPSLFMAPSHSFDFTTLQVLSHLGYTCVTDGYGFYPYKIHDILLIPQLVSSYLPLPSSSVQTICLHTNTMTETKISKFINFVHEHHPRFVSLQKVISDYDDNVNSWFSRSTTMLALRLKRSLIREYDCF